MVKRLPISSSQRCGRSALPSRSRGALWIHGVELGLTIRCTTGARSGFTFFAVGGDAPVHTALGFRVSRRRSGRLAPANFSSGFHGCLYCSSCTTLSALALSRRRGAPPSSSSAIIRRALTLWMQRHVVTLLVPRSHHALRSQCLAYRAKVKVSRQPLPIRQTCGGVDGYRSELWRNTWNFCAEREHLLLLLRQRCVIGLHQRLHLLQHLVGRLTVTGAEAHELIVLLLLDKRILTQRERVTGCTCSCRSRSAGIATPVVCSSRTAASCRLLLLRQ